MKVIISGYHNPHFLTITEYIEFAIRNIGHELIQFDDRQHIIPGRLRSKSRLLNRLDLNIINRKLINLALAKKPQLVIVTGGYRINSRSIKILRDSGIVTVLWTTDAPRGFENIIVAAPFYDYIFCQGTEAIELLNKAGMKDVRWLPMACDPEHHRPVRLPKDEIKKYGSDIAFVGSNYPNRLDLFENLKGFDIAIWGPGWEVLPKNSILREHIRGGALRPEEWRKVYNASKIILAPHYCDPDNKVFVHQISPRIFEAMACGAFVLSDYQKDVFSLFMDGEHLVGFKTADELTEKIQYYLHHSDEREKIANRGRKVVLKKHRYVNRIEELLSIVRQNEITR